MLVVVSESCHLCCLTLTATVWQPSFEPKGTYVYVKVRRIFMNEIPSPRELISGGS